MKIRTTKFIIKEGISNTYRNKLMSLASLSIITASLIVLGIFYIISVNINSNLMGLKDQPEIQVYCFSQLDDSQVLEVETAIKNDKRIKSSSQVSKKQALDKASKELLGDNKDLIEGIDESFMSVSFIIKLNNPDNSKEVIQSYKGMSNLVYKVVSPQEVVEIISVITKFIPIISGVLLVILLTISIFIISNTIKLTVFARRKEINIMKFIGATDWFIRWPFIVEGVIIGLTGAIAAFIFVGIGYNVVIRRLESLMGVMISNEVVKFVTLSSIQIQVVLIYIIIGAVIGAMGSMISIRKHLHV
jgi:cell division transport system permease protein